MDASLDVLETRAARPSRSTATISPSSTAAALQAVGRGSPARRAMAGKLARSCRCRSASRWKRRVPFFRRGRDARFPRWPGFRRIWARTPGPAAPPGAPAGRRASDCDTAKGTALRSMGPGVISARKLAPGLHSRLALRPIITVWSQHGSATDLEGLSQDHLWSTSPSACSQPRTRRRPSASTSSIASAAPGSSRSAGVRRARSRSPTPIS